MTENNNCLFCKIIKDGRELVYQDENTAAFLDIFPVEKAHIIIVPKKHYDTWIQTSEQDISSTNICAQYIAKQLLKIYPSIKGFNIVTNNGEEAHQIIFHYHLHLIPKFSSDKGFKVSYTTNEQEKNQLTETKALLKAKLK